MRNVETLDALESTVKDLGIHSIRARRSGYWYVDIVRWNGREHETLSANAHSLKDAMLTALNDATKQT